MTLTELYTQTPPANHYNIRVSGDHVYVKDADGDITEYLQLSDGELWELRSDKAQRAAIVAALTP